MLNQQVEDFLPLLVNYLPTVAVITFDIIILVFAIIILKRNSYKYGITLMLSSILSLASNIIFIAIQYPFLFYRLHFELGLPMIEVTLIMSTWSLVLFGLNTASTILLVTSIILIYKIHKKDRID